MEITELPLAPIEAGPLTLYPYGIALALSALVSILAAVFFFRRDRIRNGALSWFLVFAIPFAAVCARIGYCICAMERISNMVLEEGFLSLIRPPWNGFLLYGALAGCIPALAIAAKRTGERFSRLADAAAPAAALMIALGRASEYITGQGFGWPVEEWFSGGGMSLFRLEDCSFFCRMPFAVPDFYGGGNWAVFMLESITAFVIFWILALKRNRRPGDRTLRFLILYASTQILFESMRQDDVLRWGFVRVNQVIGALILTGILICLVSRLDPSVKRKTGMTGGILLTAGFLTVAAMEFALEGKISVIESMPLDVCYMIMAAGCMTVLLTLCFILKRTAADRG